MDTSKIYGFLSELRRCDYHALEAPMDISTMKYNGISYDEGTETYQKKLFAEFADFKATILELALIANSQKVLSVILTDFKDGIDQYWDIPDDEALIALQQEYDKYRESSMLASIREIKFLQAMSSLQKRMLIDSARFIEALLNDEGSEKKAIYPVFKTEQETDQDKDSEIISGVQGLAEYLGCAKTTAMKIIKSGVLKKDKMQYKVGKNWKFNKTKLEKFLSDTPEALGEIKRY